MSEELDTEVKEESAPKTYTEEEVQMLLQKEGDRRISQYMKSQEKKQREADKLQTMTATEKYEYELQQRELQIEQKEKELALAENKTAAAKILEDKGLSVALVDFVVAEEADEMNSKIKSLEKAFKASVKTEVEKRLGSESPKKNPQDMSEMTKAQFNKLSLAQQNEIFMTDRPLYESLVN